MTDSERITSLEARIAELERRIGQLEAWPQPMFPIGPSWPVSPPTGRPASIVALCGEGAAAGGETLRPGYYEVP